MRTVRLGRTFDCVFVHDAVCYMTTEHDLRAAIATAAAHCRPGGVVLMAPDYVRETFRPGTDHGGHDGAERSAGISSGPGTPTPPIPVISPIMSSCCATPTAASARSTTATSRDSFPGTRGCACWRMLALTRSLSRSNIPRWSLASTRFSSEGRFGDRHAFPLCAGPSPHPTSRPPSPSARRSSAFTGSGPRAPRQPMPPSGVTAPA